MDTCCICDTKEHSKVYKSVENHTLLRCRECGLIYLDTRIDPQGFIKDAQADLSVANKDTEYWSFPDLYLKYNPVFKKFFRERFLRCLRYNPAIKTVFDIGSGYGFWMDYCKSQGLEVKGIDISEDAVSYGKKFLKLDIEMFPLKHYAFQQRYDLYNLCDVLEHLDDPNKELRLLYENMKDNSLLYIQVPDAIGFRLPYRHALGLPHHIWQFNYKALKRLLEKNGFKVIKKWHGVLGVIGSYERNEVNLFTKSKWFLADVLKIGNRLAVLCKKDSGKNLNLNEKN